MVTSKFHPPSKPQPYNTVSSTRVTMPCTRSSDLIHPIADRLYPFTNIPPLLPSYSPWQPLSSCFCESDFFFDATSKWLPSTFLPLISQHIQNLSFSFTMNNLSETVLKKNLFLSLILTSCPFQISFQSCSAFLKKNYISNSLLPLHFYCCFYFITSHWTTRSNSSCGLESF